jgi:phenylalanyl-tRNA synthetase beta chain
MLTSLASNLRNFDRVAMFEIGKVYWPLPGELLPAEPEHIAIGLSGPRDSGAWLNLDTEPLDFFDLKGIVEELLDRLNLHSASRFETTVHPLYGPRAARLLLNGQEVGILGEVHPIVRRAFDLPEQRVAVAELRLAPFVAGATSAAEMQPISSFPAVKEDLAVVVDESVTAAQVAEVMRQAGGSLLQDMRLFDVYRGQQIPPGKKSLAFSLTFQAADKTLKDADVEKVRRRIVARLGQALDAALRS